MRMDPLCLLSVCDVMRVSECVRVFARVCCTLPVSPPPFIHLLWNDGAILKSRAGMPVLSSRVSYDGGKKDNLDVPIVRSDISTTPKPQTLNPKHRIQIA
jgi:hypothetical protein